ncbi:MAG TPA: hypothetical protein VK735_39795 [Pseudonocardia sp.]|uniref:hypothetical protein n=1 Tax=Pseudonocardia sp. TaxID=60912 RepID=UPI002B756F10|nr:hypothetical protein [Pseudonocardia sp.]HTF53627.1 hypothetical protein [Pseudonocardia sp.]
MTYFGYSHPMKKYGGIVILAFLLFATACSADESESEPETETVQSEPDEPTAVSAEVPVGIFGSWDKPIPTDTVLTLSAWEVTVKSVVASTEPPDPETAELGVPEPGFVNVIAEVEAVRIGEVPDKILSFADGISLGLMGGNGVEVGENIAIRPGNHIDTGIVAPGGVISGTMMVALYVPEDVIEGSVVMVHDHGSQDVAWLDW